MISFIRTYYYFTFIFLNNKYFQTHSLKQQFPVNLMALRSGICLWPSWVPGSESLRRLLCVICLHLM